MILLTEAFKIAFEKVLLSVFNIFLFRYAYSLTLLYLSGFYAFIATIYLSSKVRLVLQSLFYKLKYKLAPNSIENDKFDINQLRTVDLEDDSDETKKIRDEFFKYIKSNSENHIFSHIFSSSSQSSIISLVTIISVEYIHKNYEFTQIEAIFYCISVAFVICFGASLRYTHILNKEWLELLNSLEKKDQKNGTHKMTHILCVYDRLITTPSSDISKRTEFVCLWTIGKVDQNLKDVNLRFLSSNHAINLKELVNHFVKTFLIHQEQQNEESQNNSGILPQTLKTTRNDNYDLLIPDYYDVGLVFSNTIRSFQFKVKETWKEFYVFPLVNFKVNKYSNSLDLPSKIKQN